VRVLQLGRELDLAPEPVHAHAGRELRQQHLDHYLAPQRRLGRQEYPRHAATPQLALQPVGIAKCALQLLAQVGAQQGSTVGAATI
jgi:hypothetical protein